MKFYNPYELRAEIVDSTPQVEPPVIKGWILAILDPYYTTRDVSIKCIFVGENGGVEYRELSELNIDPKKQDKITIDTLIGMGAIRRTT